METNKYETTLLSRNESNIIKGILILAVVIGHNVILTANIQNLWYFLNSFNVSGFFIITGLYGRKNYPFFQNLKKYIFRIYGCYLVALFAYILLYKLLQSKSPSISCYLHAIFLGGEYIKESTGFLLLWFLPAFFWFSVFYDLWLNLFFKKRKLAIALFIAAAFFAVCAISKYSYFHYLQLNCVCAGIFFIPFTIIANFFLRELRPILLFAISAILVALFIFDCAFDFNKVPVYLMPVSFLIFLFCIAKFGFINEKNFMGKILLLFGRNSLLIYLTHSLIFYFFYTFLKQKIFPGNAMLQGILFLLFTIILSTISSICIKKFFHLLANALKSRLEARQSI